MGKCSAPGWPWLCDGAWGALEGVLLEESGHFFLPSMGQRVTIASVSLAECDASKGEQLLVLISHYPAARSKHGCRNRVELPHLLQC